MNSAVTLVKVELTRLRWRRAIMALVVLAVLVPAAVFAIRFFDTQPRDVDELVSDYGTFVLEEIDACVSGPIGQEEGDLEAATARCETIVAGQFGNTLDLRDEREEGGALAVMLLVGLLMLLVGTTFAGHDWNTGSMSNQLLFEPRRARVWAAKAAAVSLLAGVVTFVVSAAYWSAVWATVAARDLPIQDHAVAAGYKQVVLAAAFAVACGLFGFALTMLLRSTVGSIGLMFAAMFLAIVAYGVFGLDGGGERFMPWGNFAAYAVGGYEYYDDSLCMFSREGNCDSSQLITRADSLIYFGLILVVTLVPSVLTFRERDLP